ncbi:hypothetical protein GCM10010205_75450 [Streptomyces nojiriensis]|nr:hypothetical protein GCM10010205_75450 [Streptomyces nojiriensis]
MTTEQTPTTTAAQARAIRFRDIRNLLVKPIRRCSGGIESVSVNTRDPKHGLRPERASEGLRARCYPSLKVRIGRS